MDAQCTGCGGRVMPYRQYIFHFRPTAECAGCGRTVRLRHFRKVVATTLAALVVWAALFALSVPGVWLLVGLALAVLGGLLADFWTYRNLPWDPEPESPPTAGSA